MRVDRSLVKRPLLGLVSAAVEGPLGHDPRGLLVHAENGSSGLLGQLGIGDGTAAPDPSSGVTWSRPLLSLTGRRIAQIGQFLIDGRMKALVRANPAGFQVPSNLCAWVLVLPDGPIATATKGFGAVIQNTTAGAWTVSHIRLESGLWNKVVSTGTSSGTTGVHASWGGPNLGGGNTFGLAATDFPSPTVANSRRDFTSYNVTGNNPHFAYGFGWAAVPAGPDSARIAFSAEYID